MTLESLINFRNGTRVMRNPENHGLEFWDNSPKIGTVYRIGTKQIDVGYGNFRVVRTGEIVVLWDCESVQVTIDYRNLRIVG